MKCRVLYVNAEEKKLKLTLNVDADLERKSLQEDDQIAALKLFQVSVLFVSLCEKFSLLIDRSEYFVMTISYENFSLRNRYEEEEAYR